MTLDGFVQLLSWCGAALLDFPQHAYWAFLAVCLLCGPILTIYLLIRPFFSQRFMDLSRDLHLDFFIYSSFVLLWLLVLAWQHLRQDALWP